MAVNTLSNLISGTSGGLRRYFHRPFQQHHSCIHALFEVVHHRHLSFPNKSNHFLHIKYIITFKFISVVMSNQNAGIIAFNSAKTFSNISQHIYVHFTILSSMCSLGKSKNISVVLVSYNHQHSHVGIIHTLLASQFPHPAEKQ
jgi:hypothetical protein